MATFKKGDRVLCINVSGFEPVSRYDHLWNYPLWMHVYTIEYVYPDDTVTLCEINLAAINIALIEHADTPEAAFYAWHFVKIEEDTMSHELVESIKEEGL